MGNCSCGARIARVALAFLVGISMCPGFIADAATCQTVAVSPSGGSLLVASDAGFTANSVSISTSEAAKGLRIPDAGLNPQGGLNQRCYWPVTLLSPIAGGITGFSGGWLYVGIRYGRFDPEGPRPKPGEIRNTLMSATLIGAAIGFVVGQVYGWTCCR